MSQQIGFSHEKQAREYLVKQGLKWITSNFRSRCGELDLIMKEGDVLVFIEVRARVSAEYGGALESITYSKQRKIIKTAMHYMVTKNLYNSTCARFDVVCFQGNTSTIDWIKNAFQA